MRPSIWEATLRISLHFSMRPFLSRACCCNLRTKGSIESLKLTARQLALHSDLVSHRTAVWQRLNIQLSDATSRFTGHSLRLFKSRYRKTVGIFLAYESSMNGINYRKRSWMHRQSTHSSTGWTDTERKG